MPDPTRQLRGRRSQQRGKAYERDIATLIGGKRYPANVGGPCDVDHALFACQVKSGAKVVTEVIRDGVASAEAAAANTNKVPLLVVVDRRGTRLKRYAVIPLEALIAWAGLGEQEEE